MSKVPVININKEYIQQFLKHSGISGAEFGRTLGYSDHWWTSVQKRGMRIKPNVAKMMCRMYELDYDKLVAKAPDPIDKYETLTVDGEVVEAFGKWLARVEGKLDKLLSMWGES